MSVTVSTRARSTTFASQSDGGLIALPHRNVPPSRASIMLLAARHRLPAVYPYRYFAVEGGLMSYGPDQIEQWRGAATYVDRILRGEKSGELPVQAATKYEFVINLKAAKTLGLDVPPVAARPRRRGDRVGVPCATIQHRRNGQSFGWTRRSPAIISAPGRPRSSNG